MKIRILIADDHAIVAEGLQSLINAQSDMEVVGLVLNGREAIWQTLETKPDLVIMDNAMPELNGIEAARIIRRRCAQTRVVMLSMHSTSGHVHRALQAGVGGYVLKESVGRELVDAIRTVHAGRRYLSKPLADELLDRLVSEGQEDPLSLLSDRERQVLQLIAEGHSIIDIAGKLSLSRKTVETYRERMKEKLDLNDLASLIKFAIQHGMTSLN